MSWFQILRSTSVKKQTPAGHRVNRARLGVELLEDRLMPSTNNLVGGGAMAAPALQAAAASAAPSTVAPAAPSLLGPIGNVVTPLPTFTWSAPAGAASYQLWVQVTGQTTPLINVSNLTATSFTPTQPLAPNSYTMFVRAFSSTGQASVWSVSKAFTVAPATPTLLSPTGSINTHLPTFTWSASAGAASYQLWVQVTGQTTPLINVSNLTATSYAATQSLAAGSYTMFIRAFGNVGQSSYWSGAKTFSVAPDAPTLLGPIGSINTHLPTFTWSAPAGAASYQLWVQVTGQTTPLINVSNLTSTSYTATQSLATGSYTMFIRAFGNVGQSSYWSGAKTFSVAPDAPTVLAPIGTINTQTPTYSWTAQAGAATYALQVVNAQNAFVINVMNLTATTYTPTQALAPGSYTMYVRALNSAGQSSFWSVKTFTVALAAPATPTLLGPSGAINTPTPTFSWTAQAGAATYALQVLNSQNTLVIDVMNLTATSYTPTQPLTPGSYTMMVRALNSTGQSSFWSAPAAFSVAAPPPVVNLGSQIVSFALGKLNTTVGGGECTDLVNAALKAAGAKTTDDFGVTGLNADYVWGTLVAVYHPGDPASVLADVRPGDIIQYRDVHITSGFSTFNIPHHSAIVQENLGNKKFNILEQNVNGERWVHADSQDLTGMDAGTVWIYRPVAK